MISQSTIERVREANDVVEVVGESVPNLKRAGKDFKALCPFHQEKTPSFMVSPSKGIFHCFGCGKGGDVFKFIMEIERCSYPEAIRKLAERKGIPIEDGVSDAQYSQQIDRKKHLYNLLQRAAAFYQKCLLESEEGRAGLSYLRETRRLAPETLEEFQLGWAPAGGQALLQTALRSGCSENDLISAGIVHRSQSGRTADWMRGRVVFPILDTKGHVVAFGGRILEGPVAPGSNPPPKYLNTPETEVFQKGRNLYGLYQGARAVREKNEIFVVEGYMDVIAAHQAGLKNAVAPLGTALTSDQGQILKRYTDQVTLVFDADKAGESAAMRGIDLLLDFDFAPMVISLGDRGSGGAKDIDEFLRKSSGNGLEQILSRRVSFVEFELETLLKKTKGSPEVVGKVAAGKALVPVLSKIRNEITRSEMVRLAAQKLGVPESSIYGEMRKKVPDFRKKSEASEPVPQGDTQASKAESLLICLALAHPELRERIEELDESCFADARSIECLKAFGSARKGASAAEIIGTLTEETSGWVRPIFMEFQKVEGPAPSEVFESVAKRILGSLKEQKRQILETNILKRTEKGESVSSDEIKQYRNLTQETKGTVQQPLKGE